MLDVITALRNNNLRKIPQYDPMVAERSRKQLKAILKNRGRFEIMHCTGSLLAALQFFQRHRCSLLASFTDVVEACGYSEGAHINMLQLLLYGSKNLLLEANKIILNLIIKCITETERFG